ncbi:hypothetical protein [Arcanobacterium canis]
MEFVDISTFTTVAGVVAATTFTRKTLGTTGRWNTLLAVLWGVVLTLADYYATGGLFDGPTVVKVIMGGFALGLAASGIYDIADKTGTRLEPADAGKREKYDPTMIISKGEPPALADAEAGVRVRPASHAYKGD